MSSMEQADGDHEEFDLLDLLGGADVAADGGSGQDQLERKELLAVIEDELQKLPDRQREAFLLRYWEEMDVAETADIMGCSEGSVKTHCSRAVHALAKALQARGVTR